MSVIATPVPTFTVARSPQPLVWNQGIWNYDYWNFLPSYSLAQNVADLLNFPSFTATSNPTLTQVLTWMGQTDQYIDHVSGHNWRTNVVTNELHDAYAAGAIAGIIIPRFQPLISVQKLEYLQIGGTFITGFQGFPGDPTNTQGLEPYYVYTDRNMVVWHKLRLDGRQRYRLSYTWGYYSPPLDIQELSALLTARKVLLAWAGKFMPAEDVRDYKRRFDLEIVRLTAKIAHRPSGLVA